MRLKVNNWKEFQHYKDREPPWIKLHKRLLDNYEFHCLPVASRALAPLLWLVASEDVDGIFDANLEKLAFRFRQSEKQINDALKPLIDKGFFEVLQDDSNTLADCKQDAPLDRVETYKQEGETKARFALPDWVPEDAWNAWLKSRKTKASDEAKKLNLTDLEKLKDEGHDPRAVLEQSTKRGWTGLFPIKAETQKQGAWWSSDASIEAKARELGMWPPRGGESWSQLKGRIEARLAQ